MPLRYVLLLKFPVNYEKIPVKLFGCMSSEEILNHIDGALHIMDDVDKLLSPEDFNPVLGKLQMVKKEYQKKYYHAHEQYVGGKVDWSKLSGVVDSADYAKLKVLKGVELLDRSRFMRIESDISSLSNLHCQDFRVEVLDKKVKCPKCSFPEGIKFEDIDSRIAKIDSEIRSIYDDWEATILTELESYKDNLQYLTADEKLLIEDIIRNGKLPDTISKELVIALNNLFRELESIEVSPSDIIEHVFKDSQVMDYTTFEDKLNDFKNKLVAGKDLSKVRIKLSH